MRSLLTAAVTWETLLYATFFRANAKDKLMSEIEALRSSSRLQPHAQVAEAGVKTIKIRVKSQLEADRASYPNQYKHEKQLSPSLSCWTELLVGRLDRRRIQVRQGLCLVETSWKKFVCLAACPIPVLHCHRVTELQSHSMSQSNSVCIQFAFSLLCAPQLLSSFVSCQLCLFNVT